MGWINLSFFIIYILEDKKKNVKGVLCLNISFNFM